MHESMPLRKLEQVRFNMQADDAIRFNDRARFGVNIVPWATNLGLQPSLQRSQQVRESLATDM
jgi:hypothetical protein